MVEFQMTSTQPETKNLVHVKVDVSSMPSSKATEYMSMLQKKLNSFYFNHETRFIVTDSKIAMNQIVGDEKKLLTPVDRDTFKYSIIRSKENPKINKMVKSSLFYSNAELEKLIDEAYIEYLKKMLESK